MIQLVRLGLACVVLLVVLPGQRARIVNLSPEPQFGWASIAVPAAAKPAEFMAFGPKGLPAVRGRAIGTHGWLMHVWIPSMGGQATWEGKFTAWPKDRETLLYERSPWVPKDIFKLAPRPVFRIGGKGFRPELKLVAKVESNPAREVYRLRSVPVQGLIYEAWLYVYTLQESVELECTITWSDREDPGYEKKGVSFALESAFQTRIDFAKRIGVKEPKRSESGRWRIALAQGVRIGDAEQYKYRGQILCRPVELDLSSPESKRLSEYRAGNLRARAVAPMKGICLDWDGHWLAFGVVPERPKGRAPNASGLHREFLASLKRKGKMFDQRPLAGSWRSGATGGQKDFGASKDGYAVTLGDPRRIWELEYNDSTYFAGFHHREKDGSPLLHARHPKWETWSLYSDHRLGGDMLGKINRPYAYARGVSRQTGDDDQHRSQNYELALFALQGGYMLEQCFLDAVESDLAQMNPKRPGAPRAQGRLLMCWANYYLLLDKVGRAKVRANMDRRLKNALNTWSGRRLPAEHGLVRVIDGQVKDDRVLKGVNAWMPWQTSIACMGYYAAWRVTSDVRYKEMAYALGSSVTQYAIFHDKGRWQCCTGVAYLKGGKPIAPSAYRVGNPQLKLSNSFFAWTLPAVRIFRALHPNDDALRQRADRILKEVMPGGPKSWGDSEWLAVTPSN